MIYIYGLVDPESHEVCYIGQTVNPNARFREHIRNGSPTVVEWAKFLKTKGYFPLLIILEKVSDGEDATNAEQWWISHGLRMKWPLLNKITVLSRTTIELDGTLERKTKIEDEEVDLTNGDTATWVRELYLVKGYSKNAIIRKFWPTMSKQKALAFINAALPQQEVTQ